MQEIEPVELALGLAAREAARGGFDEITPGHLLIALCRLSEADGNGSGGGVGLRREIERLGVDPRRFRRRLRGLLKRGAEVTPGRSMRPSPQCMAVLVRARASEAARSADGALVGLLCASLQSLAWGANQQADDGIECRACRMHVPRWRLAVVPNCPACGRRIDLPGSQDESEADSIPEEL